jgi:hypothetical protein
LVLLNFSGKEVEFYFNHPALAGNYVDLFSGKQIVLKRMESFAFTGGEYKVFHSTALP